MSTVIAAAFGREVNILKGEADELTDASYELVTNYNGRRGALMWPVVISCKYIYKVDDCIHLRGSEKIGTFCYSVRECSLFKQLPFCYKHWLCRK